VTCSSLTEKQVRQHCCKNCNLEDWETKITLVRKQTT